jgi:hypothetical protein
MTAKVPKSFHSPTWVRSWDTDVPVSRSSIELDTLLRRYGARGYTVSSDYSAGTLLIGFTMPKTWQIKTDEVVEIKLTVGFRETLRRLEKMEVFRTKRDRKEYRTREAWALEQAERVAWRQIILWVEAGLNMAASGVQTVEEAFFAHSVLPGTHARVIDVVNEKRRLLTGGT